MIAVFAVALADPVHELGNEGVNRQDGGVGDDEPDGFRIARTSIRAAEFGL